ncbi:MAG: glutamine synthetase type III, partial [Lachnospiraceae bacterium]|nr:glutamine synthetase type III [Lachnospiraceae bacterium]
KNFENDLHKLIQKTIKEHKRIIFNGSGYDDAWIKEATTKRKLLNLRTTPDCMPLILSDKNVKMLTGQNVFSKAEIESRCEIMLENYSKTIIIEANTMVDMAKAQIAPAVEGYIGDVAKTALTKKQLDPKLVSKYETDLIKKLSVSVERIIDLADALKQKVADVTGAKDIIEESALIRDNVLPAMTELRVVCDEAETLTDRAHWPFPTYGELLFGVRN